MIPKNRMLGGFLLRKKKREMHSISRPEFALQTRAIRPSLTLIRFPRFAQSSGLLRRGYYPCHGLQTFKLDA